MNTRCFCCPQKLMLFIFLIFSLASAPSWSVDLDAPGLELDGNTLDDGTLPEDRDDWNTFWNGGSNDGIGAASVTSGIIADTYMRVFRKGSKDTRDIDQWHFDVGSSPPKNDIEHAYCSAYNQSGDLVVYCGANRAVTNGTATTAFWFFGNNITADDSTGQFDGIHAEGDIFVAVDHDNGGKIGKIVVYEWSSGKLNLLVEGDNVLDQQGTYCTSMDGTAGDDICATTNAESFNAPWDSPQGQDPGAFIEIGINLSSVAPELTCVSSAMATDRASTSQTAQTKNLLLFDFNLCGVDVTKTCKNPVLSADASSIQYTIEGKVSNIGFGTLSDVGLTDNPPISGYFESYACDSDGLPTGGSTGIFPLASLASNTDVCYRATFDSSTNGNTDTVTVTATGGGSTLSETATATCPGLAPDTGLSVTKNCETALEGVTIVVNYSGMICNMGDVPLSNVSIYESHDPLDITAENVILNGILVPGTGTVTLPRESDPNNCMNYSGSYYPDSVKVAAVGQDATNPACALFSDVVIGIATGPSIFGSQVVLSDDGLPTSATCSLCPDADQNCPIPESSP